MKFKTNVMKRVCLVTALSVVCCILCAQSTVRSSYGPLGTGKLLFLDDFDYGKIPLGKSSIRVKYLCSAQLDLSSDVISRTECILQASPAVSKFASVCKFGVDSLLSAGLRLTSSSADHLFDSANYIYFLDAYYVDAASNTLTFTGRLAADDFIYEEPVPVVSEIAESRSVDYLGYKCTETNVSLLGREYRIIYCPDIALSAGPWKFNGMPGLILFAESLDGQYKFEALEIRNDDSEITRNDYPYIRVNKKQYIKMQSQICSNYYSFVNNHLSRSGIIRLRPNGKSQDTGIILNSIEK